MEHQTNTKALDMVLASPVGRLWAALIDVAIAIAVAIPFMIYLGIWEQIKRDGRVSLDINIEMALLGQVIFFMLHGYLLNRYGQTIGKRVLGISIVDLTGKKPDFWPMIAKRYLSVVFISYLPFIGGFLTTIDALFIFRENRRCVHDLIAGTMVVVSGEKSTDLQSGENSIDLA